MQRVLLVGCGFMGAMHATVYSQLERAELVGVVDEDRQRREAFAAPHNCRAFASLEEALAAADFNVVDICLPTDLHHSFTLEAAAAGKDVFCEKPMARTVEQARDMKQACERAGVRLMIGHCIRFWPEYDLLARLIHGEGDLGSLLSLNLTRFGEFPGWSKDNWLASEERSGGGILDMHIHDTDYAHYVLGSPDEMVSMGTVDERGPSFVFTTMTFGPVVCHLEGGWNLPKGTPFKMAFRAIFERGAAIMDGGPMTIYHQDRGTHEPEFRKMQVSGGGNISDLGGYYVELDYFIDRLESGEPFEIVTPESSLRSLETVLTEIEQVKARAIRAPGSPVPRLAAIPSI